MTIEQELRRLLARSPVVIGVDFDGTLACIADHPDAARPDPRAVDVLQRLAGKDGLRVAVVSGRALVDLERRLGAEVPGVSLIGEHGNDLGEEGPADPVMTEAERIVSRLASDVAGAVYEVKPRSVTFHYRMADDTVVAERAVETLRRWAVTRPGVRVLEGKKVIELSTATRTKGDAMADLARGAAGIVYIGDDVTDEQVFRMLGADDVGVKVGPGETAAPYRVPDVSAVVELLELIDLISG